MLRDVIKTKGGKKKVQPWKTKKSRGMALSKSFNRIAERVEGANSDRVTAGTADRKDGWEGLAGQDPARMRKKAARMWFCCTCLQFVQIPGNMSDEELKRLYSANFCRERLCPMCEWRRSIKVFWQVSKIMDVVREEYPDLVPVFLTLSVRNCKGSELAAVLDMMFRGWYRMQNHRKFKRIIAGFFRALEITVNPDKVITERLYAKLKKYYDGIGLGVGDENPVYDTYHPHFHVILLVDRSYFGKSNPDYMHTQDWVQLWRTSCGLGYDPVCDIRKVHRAASGRVKVAEVAKYTLKDMEFIREDKPGWMDGTVSAMSGALRGRRLVAYGGIMKRIYNELGFSKTEDDLVNVTEDTAPEHIAENVTVYEWNFGAVNYYRQLGRS